MRAGSRCLSIFTHALAARVLRAYESGPLRPNELEEELSWAAQSSLRATVRHMHELGVIAPADPSATSSRAPCELTAAGRDLLVVADALERWLTSAPTGAIPLDDTAAIGTLRVLTAGWDSTIVRALAERPHSLLELSAEISSVNYPTLKRRLAKIRSTRLAVVAPTPAGTASGYTASDWLRAAVVPLILAGRWERQHDDEAPALSPIEVETAFLLSLPLIDSPIRPSGSCALAVLISDGQSQARSRTASVTVEAKQGQLVFYGAGAAASQDTWALGTAEAWFEAVIDGSMDALRFRGTKPRLAQSVVKALRAALFPRGRS